MRRTLSVERFQRKSEYSSLRKRPTDNMAVAFRNSWLDNNHSLFPRHRDSLWARDDWLDRMNDWPNEWPKPRDIMSRFARDTDRWWDDWPRDWPRMDAVMPRFTSHLDRLDSNWRHDPFWKDLYPQWAEPIFKEGIDVNSSIVNDERRFAVDIDAYQFRPEEIQVKTLDDTLLVEGRHEEVRDRDNFTKMYFVRKYQLPNDVHPADISSSIDTRGRLTVEAQKRAPALTSRERLIPVEGTSKFRSTSRTRHDSGYSNGYSHSPNSGAQSYSPVQVDTGSHSGRSVRIDEDRYRSSSRQDYGYQRDSGRGVEIPIQREFDRADSRVTGRDHVLRRDDELNDQRNGGRYQSESYYRTESRSGNSLSPHQVTMSNEDRHYSNGTGRRASFDTTASLKAGQNREQLSPGRKIFDEIRGKFENGFRSHSRGAEARHEQSSSSSAYQNGYHHESSRNGGYRVDSPASTGILKTRSDDPPRAESRSESVRSVKIVRTYN